MWREQLLALPGGFAGMAYDVRGFGPSTTDHHFFSIDLFASDLLAFNRQENFKNVILCGLSMGGYIALRAFEKSPDTFKGIVLCDTNSSADANEGKLGRFQSIYKLLAGEKESFADEFVRKILSKTTIDNKPEIPEFVKSMILSIEDDTICATQLALASRTDTTDFLTKIQVPALVIRGEQDELMKPEQAQVLSAGIKNSEFAQIPDSGHLPNLENPKAFNSLLNLFLKQHFPV
jgi:pimeloyl-ACP methyl ester carboxylesterase